MIIEEGRRMKGEVNVSAKLRGYEPLKQKVELTAGPAAVKVSELIKRNAKLWKKTLAIEMGYTLENYHINCDLLLLFTDDSIDELSKRISYLTAD